MLFKDVILAINGLRERDKMHEAWMRRATFIIAASGFGAKNVIGKEDRLWPTDDVKKNNIPDRAKEQLRKFKEAEAFKRAKNKLDAGRVKTDTGSGNKAG